MHCIAMYIVWCMYYLVYCTMQPLISTGPFGATRDKTNKVDSPSTPFFRVGLRDFLQKHFTLPLPYPALLSCNVSAEDRWWLRADQTAIEAADGQRGSWGQSDLPHNPQIITQNLEPRTAHFVVNGSGRFLLCKRFFAPSEIEDDGEASFLPEIMMLFFKAAWMWIFPWWCPDEQRQCLHLKWPECNDSRL